MKLMVFILTMVAFQFSWAGIAPTAQVTGVVSSFDGQSVVLDQDGKKITVPRDAFPKEQKFQRGDVVSFSLKANLLKDAPAQMKNSKKKN